MKRPALCAGILSLLALNSSGGAQERTSSFAFERSIETSGAGPRRISIDAPLLSGGSPFRVTRRGGRAVAVDGLADLRLYDAAGGTVPYLLVHPPAAEPTWVAGRLLSVPATRRTSGFEVDLGDRAPDVNAIRIEGVPAPFLKRLSIEGSGDRSRWVALAPEATLFDLPAEALRKLEVEFPRGPYRHLRVTWNDADSGRVALPTRVHARTADVPSPPAPDRLELPFEREPSEPSRSRYRVRLPGARIPVVALEMDVGSGHVFRRATVTESRFAGVEAAPAELGGGTLARVVRDGAEAANLRVAIAPPAESEIQLVIEDGDNAPLDLQRVFAVLADLPQIYFEAPIETVVARYGSRGLKAPTYDLEAVRASLDLARVAEARWGEPRALPDITIQGTADITLEAGAALDAAAFTHVRSIAGAGGGLVALQLDAAVLAHSRGPAERFADVRLLDGRGRQVPYLVERRDVPLAVDLGLERANSRAAEAEPAPGQARSVYRLTLPYARLPAGTLLLQTPARVFQREVKVGVERAPDRSHRDTWFQPLGAATWRHVTESAPARPLAIPVKTDASAVLLVIDERDNAPLPVSSATLHLPSYRLRYFEPQDGRLQLAYGRRDLEAPRYDLGLLAERVMGAAAREVTLPPPAAAPDSGETSPPAVLAPAAFWVLLGVAVAAIAFVIVRALKGKEPAAPSR